MSTPPAAGTLPQFLLLEILLDALLTTCATCEGFLRAVRQFVMLQDYLGVYQMPYGWKKLTLKDERHLLLPRSYCGFYMYTLPNHPNCINVLNPFCYIPVWSKEKVFSAKSDGLFVGLWQQCM